MITTIQLDNKVKEKLDSLKVHHRETYNELLFRLINSCDFNMVDKENLIETVEVLSDPKTMREIAEALERMEKGNYGTSLGDVEKELGL